ncbi:cystathionine beta-lyase [Blochmannia endosymbiont of Camponotus (Colobopsis) obliquus]|uniref:cystathionine beta-lyase n=1 Tax=Blochmannia endosymbiont of Camponotus (Colobopsis) obliquus TaxID=1505597 RepID=UPI00061A54E1|nr:cystathionine beta-lyase [Blochmannia endosymbiont of Camponotus (Colobopsis) obliquus]AKC60248.1 Cystathionine beta-lyase MetC [Blochmannia endosymbiont of Camponotus (Colobopsis) obliquus]
MTKKNIETSLIIAGRNKKYTQGSINPVIQRASSIIFDSYYKKKQATNNCTQNKLCYGRRGTLTHFALKEAMMQLEHGAGCSLYPCGTAAIASSILAFVSAGDNILVTDAVYEPTKIFCQNVLRKMQISVTWFDPLIGNNISSLIKQNTRLIFLESPGSLTMEVQDIPGIIEAVRKKSPNITIILDNTWSAGIFLQALNVGVDISIQSGTKYLVGHSDAMIGTAVANAKCWKQLSEQSYLMGQTVDPDTAYMTLRGLRTLYVRLKQHEKNALHIAHWLSNNPFVYRVNHPALPECKGHKYFVRDFSGSSGLFSFILKKRLNFQQLTKYLDNFKYFHIAYSWGGFESLILTSQPEELKNIRKTKKLDFTGTLVRLHIGLENTDDLIRDLSDGFNRIKE